MRLVYSAVIFLNSFLLFLVQPLIAKRLLPLFGGSPLVWNTCMLFFQFVLLLGYLYAHLSFKWAGSKKQPWLHGAVLLIAVISLPIGLSGALRGAYENALSTNPHSLLAQPALMLLAMLSSVIAVLFAAASVMRERAAVKARLLAAGQRVDLRRVPGTGEWQLFTWDPNGARVELDFAGTELEA